VVVWELWRRLTDERRQGMRGNQVMACDIAKTLIEQIAASTDLLFTLALAICGGVGALTVQVVLHNSDPSKARVGCPWSVWLVTLCFVLEAGSAWCGWRVRGTLVNATSIIFRATVAAQARREAAKAAPEAPKSWEKAAGAVPEPVRSEADEQTREPSDERSPDEKTYYVFMERMQAYAQWQFWLLLSGAIPGLTLILLNSTLGGRKRCTGTPAK
jgi:hypothetical protein